MWKDEANGELVYTCKVIPSGKGILLPFQAEGEQSHWTQLARGASVRFRDSGYSQVLRILPYTAIQFVLSVSLSPINAPAFIE